MLILEKLRLPAKEYIRPLKEEHKSIADYLMIDFFEYLDGLTDNRFSDDNEKEFLKRFIRATKKAFKESQSYISDSMDFADHSVISAKTERLNFFLEEFSNNRVDPPIGLFYHHLNSKNERKRKQCHLACAKRRDISTVKGASRIHSWKIVPLNEAKKRGKQFESSIPHRLLSFIWNYPKARNDEESYRASWAVKESAVLLGNLETARQRPGLGVAIFSIELALKVFASCAKSRIDNCIGWAFSEIDDKKPYMMKVSITHDNESYVEIVLDFRHTIALAIILARTQKKLAHLEQYVKLMFDPKYKEEDIWKAGEGVTVSPVFTAIYGIELLTLCNKNNNLQKIIPKDMVADARNKALQWLITYFDNNGLWKSNVNVMEKYNWEPLWVSSWVLRRLVPLDINNNDWHDCVNMALGKLIHAVRYDSQVWSNSKNEIQRFRVEARIASAVSVTKDMQFIDSVIKEDANTYLEDAKSRFEKILTPTGLSDDKLDLATALFLVDSMIEPEKLQEYAVRVAEKDG